MISHSYAVQLLFLSLCFGCGEASESIVFFDPHDFYQYHLDPAEGLEDLLARCAGPRPELGQE